MIAGAVLPPSAFGPGRVMNLPGITVTVAEQVEALKRFAGAGAADRISWEPDPAVQALVLSWPGGVTSQRALAAGLTPDESIDAIVEAYIEDDFPGGPVKTRRRSI